VDEEVMGRSRAFPRRDLGVSQPNRCAFCCEFFLLFSSHTYAYF
jgi:hypothetical protein